MIVLLCRPHCVNAYARSSFGYLNTYIPKNEILMISTKNPLVCVYLFKSSLLASNDCPGPFQMRAHDVTCVCAHSIRSN